MELAAELHGGPVFPVMPALMTSTDDSTLFICEGEQPSGKVEWWLANPDDVEQQGTHSLYDTDDNNGHLSGLRVRPWPRAG
jgi:hypothetical protein